MKIVGNMGNIRHIVVEVLDTTSCICSVVGVRSSIFACVMCLWPTINTAATATSNPDNNEKKPDQSFALIASLPIKRNHIIGNNGE